MYNVVISKETVMLRGWGVETNVWLINRVFFFSLLFYSKISHDTEYNIYDTITLFT